MQGNGIFMKKFISIVALSVVAFSAQAERSGDEIYSKSCTFCHATGVAGAPKKGDTAAWEARLANGVDTAIASIKSGKGAMPPKGLCNDCTDDQFKSLIDFMTK